MLQTIGLDRGGFACALGGDDLRQLFIVATRWDPENIGSGERTGQVLVVEVAVPGIALAVAAEARTEQSGGLDSNAFAPPNARNI